MEPEKIKIVFGANVRRIRMERDMTQATLAERSGTVGNYIALIEKGIKFPSAQIIERVAAALEVESTELFTPLAASFTTPWGYI